MSITVEFIGAAGEVTGSCHLLRTSRYTILLDCGLIQGGREDEARNAEPFPFDPATIDAVVLSHAHIDHSGRLPLLVQRGYRGPVHTHNATVDLCEIMLRDAAFLEEKDTSRQNRRRSRRGERQAQPLFTQEDAASAMRCFRGMRYNEEHEILPGITVRLRDAGHIMGSAIVELWIEDQGATRKLVYSGDLGQRETLILRDPTLVEEADAVIMETTYGDRLHRSPEETITEIGEVISSADHDRGNVLIPAFAVGRSQEVLYLFGKHYRDWGLERWHIFLDSPMAIEASRIYWDYPHLYDEEATRLNAAEAMPQLPNLHLSRQAEDSMAINRIKSGAIVIAGSGMCTGGRIIHHLRHNLARPQCHVMIVGYQAFGTLGRRLVNGEASVRIFGEDHPVRATIHTIGGLSAHGDRDDLLWWARGFSAKPAFCLVHGEARATEAFRTVLRQELGVEPHIAWRGDVYDLVERRWHAARPAAHAEPS